MELHHAHAWAVAPAEARALQTRMRSLVETCDRFGEIRLAAGIDVGFHRPRGLVRAAVAVLSLPGLRLCDQALAVRAAAFPYVPGLLSFREIPVVLDALARLGTAPDLLVCDGQGYAHPRRFGLACHLGVLTDTPCIGVAKTRLLGTHEPAPAGRGQWTALRDGDEVIGAVLRSRAGVKPVYVSIGHRVSLASAVALTMALTGRYRLPETTRHAHRLASGRW